MKRCLLFLALAVLVTACSPAPAPPMATDIILPTETALPDIPTVTITPRALAETPTATPDFNVTATAIVNAVMTASSPRLHASYLSPDQQWRVEVIIYDCVQVGEVDTNAYEELQLIEVSTRNVKVIDSQLQYCGGLGAFGLEGRFWSPNSRYFYYTDAREGVPDGLCGYWERPLFRLDVTTQYTEALGMGTLSPDATKLATWQNTGLVVWSLDEGEIGRSSAAPVAAFRGPIVWSPDGKSLVYLQTEDYCSPSKSYVVRLDLPDLNADLLLESESPSFTGAAWDNPNWIKLTDWEGNVWKYDFKTRKLEPLS